METFQHDLKSLFSQLGLNNTPEYIEQFIAEHSLAEQQSIFEADFWQPAQKQFLRESHDQDSDWCAVVNEFDGKYSKIPTLTTWKPARSVFNNIRQSRKQTGAV